MKRETVKKLGVFSLTGCLMMSLCFPLVACATPSESGDKEENKENMDLTDFTLSDAPEGFFQTKGEDKALALQRFELVFPKTENGYGVHIYDTENGKDIQRQDEMVNITVMHKGSSLSLTYAVNSFSAAYSIMEKTSYGYLMAGKLETPNGTVFLVEDAYYAAGEDVFGICRKVNILTAGQDDGFESSITLYNSDDNTDIDSFDCFIPSILYKDTNNMISGALASSLTSSPLTIKESRTGMPLSMAYDRTSGYALGITHLQPQVDVGGVLGGGLDGAIDNRLQYGAVGLVFGKTPVGVQFVYPCVEGPTSYDGMGTARRFHAVETGNSHTYKVGIVPSYQENGEGDGYNRAMVDTYLRSFEAQHVETADIPIGYGKEYTIGTVYEQNIDLFKNQYTEYNGCYGFPFATDLPNGGNSEGLSFQMGFVGQQIPAAYQLLHRGYKYGDLRALKQGEKIVGMWADNSKIWAGGALPYVWWSPYNNSYLRNSGGNSYYPIFLRCLVDGMEGMLDAYRVAHAYGDEHSSWKDRVIAVASALVQHQNPNGSFYRAYQTDGTVSTDQTDSRYQCSSELNTPIAVRFLAKMYEFTGEVKYRDAAVKAADYAYNNLYLNLGKYVGGTPDNSNTVDKEAAVYAMYCFNSAYLLTNDAKYLKAAKHAAVSAMSWTYTFDFAVPNQSKDYDVNPFKNGGVMGFSVIALGNKSADNFSAYTHYETYKTYLITGDARFRKMAIFLQNATKLCSDFDGRTGYAYPALAPEATVVADFSFTSTCTWLPWSGVANLEPITNVEKTFGTQDIEAITADYDAQVSALITYGCGGKIYSVNV